MRDNVARYVAESGEAVACLEIGGDYERELGARFAAGQGPDVFHAQRAEAALWGARGHIRPLDETRFGPLLRRMDPRMVAGARDADGQLLGLTYYNGGPFALFAHTDFADAGDLEFGSWDVVLDYLRRAKRDGLAQYPFLPRWHSSQTGLVWSLLCHLASEGVTDLGQTGADEAIAAVLGFFAALVDEGLAPPQCLDDRGDGPALQRWVSGQHMLSFTTDYLAMDAAKAARKPLNLVLKLPGKASAPLMPGHALLCLREGLACERLARSERLLAYLGGTVTDDGLAVHERWLRECLFGVPYGEVERLPGMREAMTRAFAPSQAKRSVERLLDARAHAMMSPPTHRPFMLEWTGLADAIIRNDLLRQRRLSPQAASAALLEAWQRLAQG
ncbi:multiple sugar transport system substrate-binding protein [Devosia psychrophila]|uniref:Multiple sugar transport system substrate-binding protein n=1 Tax=Devosia psychrophila TaxID=728005 RepID=A0A1I1QTU1_9HYPH|nr:multiple sugar transport system substrate-binding protein [Devosia psychrophila]